MKIQGTGSFFYHPRNEELVREKQTHSSDADGGAGQGQNSYSQGDPSSEKQPPEQSAEPSSNPSSENPSQSTQSATPSPSADQISEAIQSFHSNASTRSNGLCASVEGTGPGLKIVLKDGTGNIIRHFSGEEFIRLRDANPKDSLVRGKILDRKL